LGVAPALLNFRVLNILALPGVEEKTCDFCNDAYSKFTLTVNPSDDLHYQSHHVTLYVSQQDLFPFMLYLDCKNFFCALVTELQKKLPVAFFFKKKEAKMKI
jgi:hypothetical protein